jgi:hypothetical protein
MDFLDLNSIKHHLSTLSRYYIGDPFFRSINVDQIELTIYANIYSFCQPRNNFDQIFYYQSVELQLLETIKEEQHSIAPTLDNRFKNFNWSKYFQYEAKGLLKPSHRGQYVLVEDLPQIIRDIYKVQQFKSFY